MPKTRTTGALLAAAALTPAAITAPAFAHDSTGDQTQTHQDNGRHCGWADGRGHHRHHGARAQSKASPRNGQGCPMPQRRSAQSQSQQQQQQQAPSQTAPGCQGSQASQASHASQSGATD
jgi:hypothetical protein